MGTGEEKKGLTTSGLITIILIAVLVILGAILIWIVSTPEGFDRFKKKPKRAEPLKPVMNQQLHNPSEQLELVEGNFKVLAELS